MVTGPADRLLFPSNLRALEHLMAMPEIRPLRIFSVRWPLWQVEVRAKFRDSQPFDVVDHFLLRGVVEGRLHTIDDLARFFGLSGSLVTRGVDHLVHVGQLCRDARDQRLLQPTVLGSLSARDGVRYVVKESRQFLLFDAFTHDPFPRTHYDDSVHILLNSDESSGADGQRRWFKPLTSTREFPLDAVRALGGRADRTQFNVPSLLEDLTPVSTAAAWLPAHLVLTEGAVLAFTAAAQARDLFVEDLCRRTPQVVNTLRLEGGADPRQIWLDWLRTNGLGRAMLGTLPNGVWRATLPPQVFGQQLPHQRMGSFQVKDGYFLQLWCDHEKTRQMAVRNRALKITGLYGISRADFDDTVASVANLLEVLTPTFDELLQYAAESGTAGQLRALESMR